MNQFRNAEFVIVDVETTGLSPRYQGRIIERTAVKVKDLRVTDRFHSLIDPQCPISYGAFGKILMNPAAKAAIDE